MEDELGEAIVLGGTRYPWEGTDRDYHYEEVCFFISCFVTSLFCMVTLWNVMMVYVL